MSICINIIKLLIILTIKNSVSPTNKQVRSNHNNDEPKNELSEYLRTTPYDKLCK